MNPSGDEHALSTKLKEWEDDDEEEEFSATLWWQLFVLASGGRSDARVFGSGSAAGKGANVLRDFAGAHTRYMLRYFWPHNEVRPGTNLYGPSQSEVAFERRFRMPRFVFNRVLVTVCNGSPYMCQGLRPDATGRKGISPLMKVITALRQLAYGIPADLSDDLFDVSETTARKCLKEFCRTVVTCFEHEYLRRPSAEDLKRIELQFRALGFPGCIGAVDCAGWYWKNAPKALQGSLIGKDGAPCLRAEVICDMDLWIWSFQFGLPGVYNDLQILDNSDYFAEILSGAYPPVAPNFKIDGESFDSFYYLADGIYPRWKIFLNSIRDPTTPDETRFSAAQEGVRKAVERVFGVLFRRFKIMFIASELWSASDMNTIATACVILHNMIVEARRDSYTSDGGKGLSSYFCEENDESEFELAHIETDNHLARFNQISCAINNIKDRSEHNRLKRSVVNHIARFGKSSGASE